MDPFSITVGALGITEFAISSIVQLHNFINGLAEAKEVKPALHFVAYRKFCNHNDFAMNLIAFVSCTRMIACTLHDHH
jgi:hypothetical protein